VRDKLVRDVVGCLNEEAAATLLREVVGYVGEEALGLTLGEAAEALRSHADNETMERYLSLGMSPAEAADRMRRSREFHQAELNEVKARAEVVGPERAVREWWSQADSRPSRVTTRPRVASRPQARARAPRRNVRTAPRRARAPGSSSDDDPEPDVDPALRGGSA
jgi:hypothetical protein